MIIEYDLATEPMQSSGLSHANTKDECLRKLGKRFARLIELSLLDAPGQIIANEKSMIASVLGDLEECKVNETLEKLTPRQVENAAIWAKSIRQARELDRIVREAMRPVFDRLKKDAPDTAPAMALAMICRALRMLQTADGADAGPYRMAVCQAALMEVTDRPDHP